MTTTTPSAPSSSFNKCVEQLQWSFDQLQLHPSSSDIQAIAKIITTAMEGPWRYFHTTQHVFDVGGSEDAIEVLAALFHDLVYVQVDSGVSYTLSHYLVPFIHQSSADQLAIKDRSALTPVNFRFEMLLGVFGFKPGMALSPFSGQNEFLSAIVAVEVLHKFLDIRQLTQIAACIEATIPFRADDKLSGQNAIEMLFERLSETNSQCGIGFSSSEIQAAIERAVRMANRDIGNFALEDVGLFLDNTWKLLPETNHNLRNASSYSIRQFRVSLQKMEGFLSHLNPNVIFAQFQGVPSVEDKRCRAQRNLEISTLYLGCKLVSLAVLEAISYRLGLDFPLSCLTGDLPRPGYEHIPQLSSFLPPVSSIPLESCSDVEQHVFKLLQFGRVLDTNYDRKNSPLACFILNHLGFEKTTSYIAFSKEFFNGKFGAEEFLQKVDPFIVE